MDGSSFDALARSLTGAAHTRRQVLTGLAGSALATLAEALGFAEAGATHVGCLHVGERCTDPSQCCSSQCKRKRGTNKRFCRAHHVERCTAAKDVCLTGEFGCGDGSCFCWRTTGGANFCGGNVSTDRVCMECTADAECAEALETPGAACIDLSGGCSDCPGSTTLCAKPCKKTHRCTSEVSPIECGDACCSKGAPLCCADQSRPVGTSCWLPSNQCCPGEFGGGACPDTKACCPPRKGDTARLCANVVLGEHCCSPESGGFCTQSRACCPAEKTNGLNRGCCGVNSACCNVNEDCDLAANETCVTGCCR
jgi:hypothetical protein